MHKAEDVPTVALENVFKIGVCQRVHISFLQRSFESALFIVQPQELISLQGLCVHDILILQHTLVLRHSVEGAAVSLIHKCRVCT